MPEVESPGGGGANRYRPVALGLPSTSSERYMMPLKTVIAGAAVSERGST